MPDDADTRTTRQRIRAHLREDAATPSQLGEAFDLPPAAALDHVMHVAQSTSSEDGQLLVRPPTCRECGFDGFDDRLNLPSRCPECKSERVREPAFRID